MHGAAVGVRLDVGRNAAMRSIPAELRYFKVPDPKAQGGGENSNGGRGTRCDRTGFRGWGGRAAGREYSKRRKETGGLPVKDSIQPLRRPELWKLMRRKIFEFDRRLVV